MSVPKLRFKEFDGDWVSANIQSLVDQNILDKPMDGNHGEIHPTSADYVENGIPFVMATDVFDGKVHLNKSKKITKEQADTLRKGFSIEGDILLTHKATIGNVAKVPELETPYIMLTPQVTYYRILDQEKLLADFMKSNFESVTFQNELIALCTGATRLYIGISEQRKLPFSYPSKSEQTKIASFLSAVDEKISQLTQKHELLSQYKQGMMQKLFSQEIRFKADNGSEFGEWEELSLSKIFKLITDYVASGSFQSLRENVCPSDDGYAYYVRQVDLANGFKNATKFVDKASYDFLSKSNLFVGDILFTNIGASVGKVFILPELNKPATVAPNLILLRVNDYNNNLFIYQFLNSEYAQNAIQKIVGGTGMPKISKTDLKSLSFSLPSLEEQTKIANFLSAIDQKIEIVAQQIEQAKQWKKGLLQQMFV
ncbi:restriction endonuclease subunit S [Acinetobacter junii]|uniref:restriction endonuclease subunit S n=1 Tax=Acinetobacter junii TaxID=40215 RepID=UPI0009508CB2|nr:restriction endonuclease subunit S [Acinetobacter junii]APU47163.1 hypothetical protein BVL33_00675 [Acinetobacter junii]TIE05359.1 restriction endonuclease subunit S [Acinetobacter junii]